MKEILSNFIQSFMNLKIKHKFILGYVFIIVIPMVYLTLLFNWQNSKLIRERYIATQQITLNSAITNLDTQCEQIENLTRLIQTNNSIQDYICGENNNVSDEIYNYIKDIHPVFAYCTNSNKMIKNITLYKIKPTSLELNSDIISSNRFEGNMSQILNLKAQNGFWEYKFTKSGYTLTYYQKIYDISFNQLLGFIKIDLDSNNFFRDFSSLPETLYLQTDSGQLLQFKNGGIIRLTGKENYSSEEDTLIHKTIYERLRGTLVYKMNSKQNISWYYMLTSIVVYIILFFLLSFIYYAIVGSLSKRIIKFKNHISHSNIEALTPYKAIEYKDEFGLLTHTYNEMIEKINYLLHEIYESELQKKEANFYALQAQIKPHFLYNVLENIRMSAELNNDESTAQMVFELGKCMRYSLNKDIVDVPLYDELRYIKSYLDIYKIRRKEKLSIEIAIYTEIDNVFCPRMVLQPIVENCLKHGFKDGRNGKISIVVTNEPDVNGINIKIADNGAGINQSDLKQLIVKIKSGSADIYKSSGHVGLKNVYNRLTSYFGKDDPLNIESTEQQGTTITVKMSRINGSIVKHPFSHVPDCKS